MAKTNKKVVDITDKLAYKERPVLVIRGREIEVNNDAETVLMVLAKVGDGNDVTPSALIDIADGIFTEAGRQVIADLHLDFADFSVVVQEAMSLIVGDEEDEKNAQGIDTMTSAMTGT